MQYWPLAKGRPNSALIPSVMHSLIYDSVNLCWISLSSFFISSSFFGNIFQRSSSFLYEAYTRGNTSYPIREARASARPLLDSNICTVTASQDYCPYFSNLHSFP